MKVFSVSNLKTTDNTNADPETRAVWVQLAHKFDIPIRCVHFTAPAKLCEHNDTVRGLADGNLNPEGRTILPHSAFSGFAARFKEPKVKEGFQDIVTIEFQVFSRQNPFSWCGKLTCTQFQGNVQQRKIWSQYWI